jgi:hypothetical protein
MVRRTVEQTQAQQPQPQPQPPRPRQGRIPAALQSVFLASNRGKTVDRPPPGKVAYKVFFRKIFFQKKPEAEKNNGNKNGYKKWNKKGNKNSGKFVKNNFYKNNNNNKQSRFSAPPQSVDKSSKILSSTSISFGKASNAKSKPTPSTRAAAVVREVVNHWLIEDTRVHVSIVYVTHALSFLLFRRLKKSRLFRPNPTWMI